MRLTIALAFAFAIIAPPTPARAHLAIVVDGLRPDFVTAELMPRLTRLAHRGIVF